MLRIFAGMEHAPFSSQAAAGEKFVLEEASISDIPDISDSRGSGEWMEACRTKFIGVDGKPLPPPAGGHAAVL